MNHPYGNAMPGASSYPPPPQMSSTSNGSGMNAPTGGNTGYSVPQMTSASNGGTMNVSAGSNSGGYAVPPMHPGAGAMMPRMNSLPTIPNEALAVRHPRHGMRSLDPTSGIKGEYVYIISPEQQPVRARMCGFGDKDRRPITPPPCVRLIVRDKKTNQDVNIDELPYQYYVLQVDIWDDAGSMEVNLVRHSSASPAMSISASTTTSFPPAPDRMITVVTQVPTALLHPGGGVHIPENSYVQHHGPPPHHLQQYSLSYVPGVPGPVALAQLPVTHNQQGLFTRNLIGSTIVNACKLKDDKGEWGLWFVLQDLSVRTEGSFRLKYSFVDLYDPEELSGLNQGHAEVLATCFSDTFKVYSAKKFPGVIESTPLSKAFATQGIKIPIRKDVKPLANQDEYDDEDVGVSNGH